MRVLLISANTERLMNMVPLPLGPALVAAATRKAGHDVLLLNLMFENEQESSIRNCIADFRPDLIGVSVRNIDDQAMAATKFLLPQARDIVAACRRSCTAPIVLGGPGYSIFPESALRYLGADIGIRGEGETAFPQLLDSLKNNRSADSLPNVYVPGRPRPQRVFTQELDTLTFPDPALWIPRAPAADFWVPVQTRRGCPLDCSYCSTSAIEGRTLRQHSPARVADWLEQLASRGLTRFNFVDNTFNLPPHYAKELCCNIIKRGLQIDFWCIVYPTSIDRELAELMARAGCREVSLGCESGSGEMLRRMNKHFSPGEVEAAARFFAEAGVFRRGFLLLGGPGETRETVEESLAFAESLRLDALKISVGLRIYPETPLSAEAVARGIIASDDDLLFPRFYLEPELSDWLPERISAYKAAHPSVI